MKFYFCAIYDGAFHHSGCTIYPLKDRILVKFLFIPYWDIPYNSITQILLKRGNIRIEYKNRTGESYIEIRTSYSAYTKLERELETKGFQIQYL